MAKFQEGDRVRTSDGYEGEVVDIRDGAEWPIVVRHLVSIGEYYQHCNYSADELTNLTEEDE